MDIIEKIIFNIFPYIFEKKIYLGLGIFLTFSYLRKFANGPKCTVNKNNLQGKVIIITGANSGIGFETAKILLEKGAKVVFACRDEKRTLSAIKKRINPIYHERSFFIKCDISDFSSIEIFVELFFKKFENFDILVNNAGAMFNVFEKINNGMEISLATNHFGGMYLTMLLIKAINPKGRIINVNSILLKDYEFNADILLKDKNFEKLQNNYDFVKQYSLSKQLQYAFGKFIGSKSLKRKYPNLEFKVASLHPGVIITEAHWKFKGFFTNISLYLIIPLWSLFTKSIFYGAQTTVHCVLEDYDSLQNGEYYSDCALVHLPRFLEDENYYKQMNKYSYELIKKYWGKKGIKIETQNCIELMKEWLDN